MGDSFEEVVPKTLLLLKTVEICPIFPYLTWSMNLKM
jgi:hypothetical protein